MSVHLGGEPFESPDGSIISKDISDGPKSSASTFPINADRCSIASDCNCTTSTSPNWSTTTPADHRTLTIDQPAGAGVAELSAIHSARRRIAATIAARKNSHPSNAVPTQPPPNDLRLGIIDAGTNKSTCPIAAFDDAAIVLGWQQCFDFVGERSRDGLQERVASH